MEIRIWGARGSYPASGARFSGFGHHTACVTVRTGDDLVVIDAGSGAAALGEALAARAKAGEGVRRIHILLSHFHHDHVMGLPFLLLGAGQGASIAIHAALGEEEPLAARLRQLFSAPYFPDEAGSLAPHVSFHAHRRGAEFALADLCVASFSVDHPGGAAAFHLRKGRRSFVYATDVEDRAEPDPAMIRFVRDADLLIHDTMFTREEIGERRGWGHATIESAAALARAAEVRRLAGFHHNPAHDDATLARQEADLRALFPAGFLAREGDRIAL